MQTSKISANGQIIIPISIRQKFGLKSGVRVAIIEQENGFLVQAMNRKYFEQFAGILPIKGRATKALLEERRKENQVL